LPLDFCNILAKSSYQLQHLGEEFVSKVTSMTTQQQAGKVALSEAPSVREVGSHTSSDHRAASPEAPYRKGASVSAPFKEATSTPAPELKHKR
jgi:hypothetical protein